jgi:hypothetical protein
MRRLLILPLMAALFLGTFSAEAATGRVIKALPFFIDLEGRHMRSPNLMDRDSYQVYLRKHPEERSGIRFDVQWKIKGTITGPLKVKMELKGGQHGGAPQQLTLESETKSTGWFSTWTSLPLMGDAYKN